MKCHKCKADLDYDTGKDLPKNVKEEDVDWYCKECFDELEKRLNNL